MQTLIDPDEVQGLQQVHSPSKDSDEDRGHIADMRPVYGAEPYIEEDEEQSKQ